MTNQQAVERAVDLTFRLVGGGMSSARAITEASERYSVARFEVENAVRDWWDNFHNQGGF